MDSRNAGGDTDWETDVQTGLVKKSGERWRRTNKKKGNKDRRGNDCYLLHSLSALHIFNPSPPTHRQRGVQYFRDHACRGALVASKKIKREFKSQSKWHKHGVSDLQGHLQLKSELMLTNNKRCHNKMHFRDIWCSFQQWWMQVCV